MRPSQTVVAVILAAGQGRRFREVAGAHSNKLLARCVNDDGLEAAVLTHTLKALEGRVARRIVVTRPEAQAVIALAQGCEVVLLDSAGMGDSLSAGVAASAQAGGWLIVLGDMPFIQPTTIDRVLAAMTADHVSVPVGPQGYGHPVGFAASFGAALRALQGDQGARRLMHGCTVVEVPVNDPGIYQDVDVPQALLPR